MKSWSKPYLVSALIIVGLLIPLAGWALSKQEGSYQAGPGSVPSQIKEKAIQVLEANYEGQVTKVYEEASTTLADWRAAEPANTSGLGVGVQSEEGPIYAIFVTGNFVVHGPVVGEWGDHDPVTYQAGRIVVDASGRFLSLQLRQETLPSNPPFGKEFDE